MATPTSRKGPTRHQLTQLKKFVMENGYYGFGQPIIQVDNEPAIIQLAQEAAKELTIPWRQSPAHTHQGQWNDSIRHCLHKCVQSDIKPITVNKLDIRNNEQKTEGIWFGKTANSGEHIIATKDNLGKVFYTRSLTRLTPELQWDKKVFDKINIPQLDTSMNADYVEEDHTGKTIIDEFFAKRRLNKKQSGH
eukprot:4248914-Amphidinium_carterae.4